MRGSVRIRHTTIMCRAELACRFPPRLRRWRWVFPLEAGIGQAPHIIAKLASQRRRSGFSPAATISSPALATPTPSRRSRLGGELLDERGDEPVEFGDFVVEVQDPAGEVFQREFGGDHRVAVSDDVRSPSRAGAKALHAGEVADLVAHLLRCGDDGVVELLQRRTAALDGGLSRGAQHPQGFHGASAVLGHLDPAPVRRGLRCRDRIKGVVLAPGSSPPPGPGRSLRAPGPPTAPGGG